MVPKSYVVYDITYNNVYDIAYDNVSDVVSNILSEVISDVVYNVGIFNRDSWNFVGVFTESFVTD